jgi:amino acid adenylation domain-containing protein
MELRPAYFPANCFAASRCDVESRTAMMKSNVLQEVIDRALDDPDHVAASDLERTLTYAQLLDEVARVGTGLSARGVADGGRVAILVPNSVDFIVAALATLWVGATFIPLAVTDPLPRVTGVVEDLTPTLIVTASASHEAPPTFEGVESVPLDQLIAERAAPYPASSSGTAYMIFTSGTTGKPKGVQIGQAAFAAAVQSTAAALGLDSRTRTLCVSPFHFDGSYANLFPTLVSGGTVVMRPREALLYPRTFFNAIENEEITYAGFTPSYLRLLVASPQFSDLGRSTLGTIALGGEALTTNDLRAVWSKVPAMRIFNRYGPTETTICVTDVELTAEMIEAGTVTIGRPHPNVTFTLVDDDGAIIENENRAGELYIGGVQLMDGYWADTTLSEAVLRSDVLPNQVLYRTGDIVLRDDRGNYVYVDRADRVIKRSGVRISLVELGAAISHLEHVDAAACVTFDLDGVLGIVAFVVVDVELSPLEIRRAASTVLPANMLPDRIEVVDALPLNRSNTVDELGLLTAAGLQSLTRPGETK